MGVSRAYLTSWLLLAQVCESVIVCGNLWTTLYVQQTILPLGGYYCCCGFAGFWRESGGAAVLAVCFIWWSVNLTALTAGCPFTFNELNTHA